MTGNYWSKKLQTVSVLLNGGKGSFRAARTYSVGSPYSIALGDVNGDGMRDIVTANPDTNTASVLINKGDGSFAAAVDYDTGSEPSDVALGDVNGDGKLDLMTANATTVSVLINAGDGTFESRQDIRTGRHLQSIAVGDLNGDGKADIVTANLSPTVSVLLGNGDGTFQPRHDYKTGVSPVSVAIGDLNKDGRLDIAVASHIDEVDMVSVLLGNGDGSFQPRRDYLYGPTEGFSLIAIGDLNGDGRPDLAIGTDPRAFVAILLNMGGGRFHGWYVHGTTRDGGSGPRAIAVGDLNGDGRPDIVTPNGLNNRISVLINTTPPH